MELKKYQETTVDVLKKYLTELNRVGPKYAFIAITEKPYQSESFGMCHSSVLKFQQVEVRR